MNNEKGLTLLEVLAAVSILSMVVAAFFYIFTKNTEFSYREAKNDVAVQIARTVIEELKPAMKNGSASLALYGQSLQPLDQLRTVIPAAGANASAARLYYPSAAERSYEITVTNTYYADKALTVDDSRDPARKFQFAMKNYFSLIEVKVSNLFAKTDYILQTYMEKN